MPLPMVMFQNGLPLTWLFGYHLTHVDRRPRPPARPRTR
jgi:hypothetical protein